MTLLAPGPRRSAFPLIGLSLDHLADPRGPAFSLHQLRAAYADAVVCAGGAPLLLAPLLGDVLTAVLTHLDGVILTGGAFDVPPALYGAPPSKRLGPLKPERTAFELSLLEGARARGLPVLGICGGMQLVNVACGGTLYQDLAEEFPDALAHEQPGDRRQPGHAVNPQPSTRLAMLVGAAPLPVNSSHHQGIKVLGHGLRESARSSDGLIEAIEAPGDSFLMGVQWHPELLCDSEPRHRHLFDGLIQAARRA